MALECKKSSASGLIISNLSKALPQSNNDQLPLVGAMSQEGICGAPKRRTAAEVDVREVYFLILHFLSDGPCRKTCSQLSTELSEYNLLPRRYHAWYSRGGSASGDIKDDGISVPVNYSQLLERYSFIEKNHLVKLLEQLYNRNPEWGAFVDAKNPTAADASTLLGTGSVSLLNSGDAAKNQDGCFWKRAGQNAGLMLREIGGGLTRHHRAPSIRAASYAIVKPSVLVNRIQIIKTFRGHRNAVYCAIFDKSGEHVITGSDDRLVKIWSTATGFCLRSCRGHEGDITDLAVSANNVLVASASNDCFIRVWRFPDGLPVSVLKGHTSAVTAIAFSPRQGCEHHLLSTSDDGTCRIWDARDSSVNARIYAPKLEGQEAGSKVYSSGSQTTQILCCAFNASGTVFVTGSADRLARVWDAAKWTDDVHGAHNHELDTLKGHEDDVNYVQFSGCAAPPRPINMDTPKDERISRFRSSLFGYESIVTCSRDGSAIIWAPRPRRYHGKSRWMKAYHLRVPPPPTPPQPPRGVPRQRLLPTPRGVNMIVWSLDNRYVLAAIMDCRICVWNAVDGSLVHSLTGHTKSTFVLDVHPYDPRLAMSAGYDGRVIIWDIWEGRSIHEYETGEFHLVDGKFSPDGTSIVISDEVGQIYLLATGEGGSQKDAKYDQFFLGDYRPLMRDVHGNVLDQETQLPPHQRNLQDLLCDANMVPYAEPYQSMYQQRRLGAIGISWRPPSVQLAFGNMDDTMYLANGFPEMMLAPDEEDSLVAAPRGGTRWVEQPIDEEAMEWEQDSIDDAGSDYTLSHENASDKDDREGSLSSTEELLDSLEEESSSEDDELSQRTHLRRSERNKRKAEGAVSTSSGRSSRKRTKDGSGEFSLRRSTRHQRTKRRSSSRGALDGERPKRPKRLAARNARLIFSQISAEEDEAMSPWRDSHSDTSENVCSTGEDQGSDKQDSEKDDENVDKDQEGSTAAEGDPSEVNNTQQKRSRLRVKLRTSARDVLREEQETLDAGSPLEQARESDTCFLKSHPEGVLHVSTSACNAANHSSPQQELIKSHELDNLSEVSSKLQETSSSLEAQETGCEEEPADTNHDDLLGKRALEHKSLNIKKRARGGECILEPSLGINEEVRPDSDTQTLVSKAYISPNYMSYVEDAAISHGAVSQQPDLSIQGGADAEFLETSESAAKHSQLDGKGAEQERLIPEQRRDSFEPRRTELANEHVNKEAQEPEVMSDGETLPTRFNGFEPHILEQQAQQKESTGLLDIREPKQTSIVKKLHENGHRPHELDIVERVDWNGEDGKLETQPPNSESGHSEEDIAFREDSSDMCLYKGEDLQLKEMQDKGGNADKRFYERRGKMTLKREAQPPITSSVPLSTSSSVIGKATKTPLVFSRKTHMMGTSWQRDSPTCLWLRQHISKPEVVEPAAPEDESSDCENTVKEDEVSYEGNTSSTLRRSERRASKSLKEAENEHTALPTAKEKQKEEEKAVDTGVNGFGLHSNTRRPRITFKTSRFGDEDKKESTKRDSSFDVGSSRSSTRARIQFFWKKRDSESSKPVDDLSWKGKKRSKKKPSWLMLTKVEEGTRYIPQLGDEVAYVLQGQDEFPDLCHLEEKGPSKSLRARLRAVEICQVVGLEYGFLAGFSGVTCKLTLKLIDEECKACGKTFKLSLPELTDFPDFLIERCRYEAGMQRCWTKRDRCKVWWRINTIDENGEEKTGEWFIGRVMAVGPKSSEFADSPWEQCVVQYKEDRTGPHRHSPWELFDVESTELASPQLGDFDRLRVLSSIGKVEESFRSDEDDYGLKGLKRLLHKTDFLNKTPVPLSLDTIKDRLNNYYYHSLEALQHDVQLLVNNVSNYVFDDELTYGVRRLAKLLLEDE